MDESMVQNALSTTCESFSSVGKVDQCGKWIDIMISNITPTASIIFTGYHYKTCPVYQHITRYVSKSNVNFTHSLTQHL